MSRHVYLATSLLKAHEGLRLKPYRCTAGKLTIGYGRNLDDVGIETEEAEHMLSNDIAHCEADLMEFGYWHGLNENQKAALIDMRYCLGPGGYRQFSKMGAALHAGDFDEAARQVLDSRFATQVGQRAVDIADLLTLNST